MHPRQMTRDQRLYLVNLNKRLAEIERQLYKEAMPLIAKMDARLADDADWINDYEIEGEVTFWLDENDPRFIEDQDNILATVNTSVRLLRHHPKHVEENLSENWNDLDIFDLDNPSEREHHCYLYHQLYDHTKLRWEDLFRIGRIWVDIKLTLQHFVDLPRETNPTKATRCIP
jgi:hypothetical protein